MKVQSSFKISKEAQFLKNNTNSPLKTAKHSVTQCEKFNLWFDEY